MGRPVSDGTIPCLACRSVEIESVNWEGRTARIHHPTLPPDGGWRVTGRFTYQADLTPQRWWDFELRAQTSPSSLRCFCPEDFNDDRKRNNDDSHRYFMGAQLTKTTKGRRKGDRSPIGGHKTVPQADVRERTWLFFCLHWMQWASVWGLSLVNILNSEKISIHLSLVTAQVPLCHFPEEPSVTRVSRERGVADLNTLTWNLLWIQNLT